jgi:hypothetical protein
MVEKLTTEVHADNRLPPSVPSGRVSCSSSGDKKVPHLRKSSTVWIWQHDKRTDDCKIILNCVRKLMKIKSDKDARKDPNFFKKYSFTVIVIAVDIAAIVFRRYCDVNGLFFDHVMNNNCKR